MINTPLNSAYLAWMKSAEYEQFREGGYDIRRELTHAIMKEIQAPDNWDMNGEYRDEFGGLFPVQVRFTPSSGRFGIALCSPGDISETWLMVLFSADGKIVRCIRECPRFDVHCFNNILELIAQLNHDGESLSAIIATLKRRMS
ncbi:conjugation system SOS inhibitor PsiB [Salmonella enterica subsp. enterica serovar Legon]|nr:conjugation system SOS inhibitor PsiB [Salmonella enterica subsp. enterica serovar Legon]EDW9825357.1 conjugation system SOS inhibitor PsiB [Salmonella enterica]EDZ3589407.1 conjugation system SOS inhibitor PsiB [Salmonella enterica subsp. enterica serovar Wagenia]